MAGQRTVKIKFVGDSRDLDRAAGSAERSLGKFRTMIGKAVSYFEKAGQTGAELFSSAFEGGLKSPVVGPAIATALVVAIAAALPTIGAGITAAVLGAVGGGVLAAGIKSAASDPRVKTAFGALSKEAKSAFKDLGVPFVEPLIRAAKTFSKTIKETIGPAVQRMGKIIAPVIDKLAPALDQFFKFAMPGIEKAVKASVPLFETLAEKLPVIGFAISDFFSSISENGDDANLFFGDMLDLVIGLIGVLGEVIAWLANLYGKIRSTLLSASDRFVEFKVKVIGILGGLLNAAVAALGWIPGIGPKLKTAQKAFQKFQQEANNELNKIHDRNIRINVWSNVGSVVANVASRLAALPGISGHKALGGPVAAGRSYLVGERGPEILTMGSGSGNITPNNQLGGGPEVLELHLDLGEGIQRVIQINLKNHDRGLKRRATARGAV